MKNALLLAGMLMIGPAAMTSARTLSPAEALARANSCHSAKKIPGKAVNPQPVLSGTTPQGDPAWYIFADGNQRGGYCVVSADDVAAPILGYADDASLDPADMPPAMKWWLDLYAAEIGAAHMEYIDTSSPSDSWAPISPLCRTRWNQGDPYYRQTPTIGGTHCVTGCVATAMAQVMAYFREPEVGTGSISYIWPTAGETLTMDFGSHRIDWDNIINDYSDDYTDSQADAVATLMKVCGYAVEMDYTIGESNSGPDKIMRALKKHFGYDQRTLLYHRDYYPLEEWKRMLYDNLRDIGPICYGGYAGPQGHQFIVDGYMGNGYFHINWGWGGTSDGYYLLTALAPTSQGIGGASSHGAFRSRQDALLGATPHNVSTSPLPMELGVRDALTPTLRESSLNVASYFINLGDDARNVKVGMEFVASDGSVAARSVAVETVADWHSGTAYSDFTAEVPASLRAGIYRVYMTYSPDGGNSYVRARVSLSTCPYLTLTKHSDGSLSVQGMGASTAEYSDLQLYSPLFFGRDIEVSARTVNHTDRDIKQTVTVALLSPGDKKRVALGATTFLELQPGEDTQSVFSGSIESGEGRLNVGENYLLTLYDLPNDRMLTDPIEVTLMEAPTEQTMLDPISNFSIVNPNSVSIDDFRINYEVQCRSGYYAGPLYLMVYPASYGTSVDKGVTPRHFIPAGEWCRQTDEKVTGFTNLQPGESYNAAMGYEDNGYQTVISDFVPFTVARPLDVTDISTDPRTTALSTSLHDGILSIHGAEGATTAIVHDLSGAVVNRVSDDVVDMRSLPTGVYIVTVTSARDRLTLKISR